MKKTSCFGTLEEWKTALMLLPDETFFELMRSVFGNIKTPFSKQRLTDDLFTLLSREEIRDNIASYIDEKDHKVIAAVALLISPLPWELENFFAGEFSYGELHALISNLEERLILYRVRDGDARRLALNPALKSVLAPFTSDSAPLFPSAPLKDKGKTDKVSARAFAGNGRDLAALFSFIEREEIFFKAEGGIRKKILDEGKKLFPDLDVESAAAILGRLGLFCPSGETFPPDRRRIRDFSLLSPAEREEYWAAALYLHLTENGRERFGFSGLKEKASLIHDFVDALDPALRYPKITLRRRAILLAKDDSEKAVWGRRLFEETQGTFFPSIDPLLETLEKCGFIKAEGDFFRVVKDEKEKRAAGNEGNAVIAMDSLFSFVLYPEIDFADALELASFCSLKADGRFELTREAAVRGFDRGENSASLVELLKRLSGGRIDTNLEWTLKDWEARYASVSLYHGEILTLAEDRRYLAEAGPLSPLISKKLAEGVYLLSSGDRRQITSALRKAGVDIFSQPCEVPSENEARNGEKKNISVSARQAAFPPPGKKPLTPLHLTGNEEAGSENAVEETDGSSGSKKRKSVSPSALKERFSLYLGGMNLSDPDRKELAARIERRLIFTEAQLLGASLKYEKLEARGLDYAGKVILAKQAVASGSVLEVSWPEPGGTSGNAAGIPMALEKKDGENYLILKVPEAKEGELRLPLGKISRLRRIKQSIFEE